MVNRAGKDIEYVALREIKSHKKTRNLISIKIEKVTRFLVKYGE